MYIIHEFKFWELYDHVLLLLLSLFQIFVAMQETGESVQKLAAKRH